MRLILQQVGESFRGIKVAMKVLEITWGEKQRCKLYYGKERVTELELEVNTIGAGKYGSKC